ncbi:MAG: hypothetical protein K6U14_00795 [Firmicutes bacterium]|nr:hypothetical protein [Alicyclobacillaceae bacterium]MCL6496155.1 hypothetical protein [Bacillota bacterium]
MHSVAGLLHGLRSRYADLTAHRDVAALLDTFYLATRYPTVSLGVGPARTLTAQNGKDAVAATDRVLRTCQANVGGRATAHEVDVDRNVDA